MLLQFSRLHARILAPLATLFVASPVAFKVRSPSVPFVVRRVTADAQARIFVCLRRLLERWASVDWRRLTRATSSGLAARFAVGGPIGAFDYVLTFRSLAGQRSLNESLRSLPCRRRRAVFVDRLSVIALQAHANHPLMQCHVIATFEQVQSPMTPLLLTNADDDADRRSVGATQSAARLSAVERRPRLVLSLAQRRRCVHPARSLACSLARSRRRCRRQPCRVCAACCCSTNARSTSSKRFGVVVVVVV